MQTHATGPRLYTGPIDCARQIVRVQGPLGLWHAYVSSLSVILSATHMLKEVREIQRFPATLLFRSWFAVMSVSFRKG